MIRIVIDNSVVVAAVSPSEVGYADSRKFLKECHALGIVFEVPSLFLAELYAIHCRNPRELKKLRFMTKENPQHINLHPHAAGDVQRLLEWLTAERPENCPTRGADLMYLLVALTINIPLVTLDKGLLKFKENGIMAVTPSDAFKLLS